MARMLPAQFCEHANEVPAGPCPCPVNCYCRSYTCKPRSTKITRNLSTPENRAYWADIDRAAKKVHRMAPYAKPESLWTAEERAWIYLESVRQELRKHPILKALDLRLQELIKVLKRQHRTTKRP